MAQMFYKGPGKGKKITGKSVSGGNVTEAKFRVRGGHDAIRACSLQKLG